MEGGIIPGYPPYGGAKAAILRRFENSHPGLATASARWNQPVFALFDGKIAAARFDPLWGMVCEYRSENGVVTVSYRHMASVASVVGKKIKAGEPLGVEGATGSLAGGKRLLYLGLWIGTKPVDPLPYFMGAQALPLENWKGGTAMMKHKIGESVQVKGCIYQNAWGSGGSLPGYGKKYVITEIHAGAGRHKPYQLGATGFIGDEDISPDGPEESVPKWEYDRVRKENETLRSMLEDARQALYPGRGL